MPGYCQASIPAQAREAEDPPARHAVPGVLASRPSQRDPGQEQR